MRVSPWHCSHSDAVRELRSPCNANEGGRIRSSVSATQAAQEESADSKAMAKSAEKRAVQSGKEADSLRAILVEMDKRGIIPYDLRSFARFLPICFS